MSRFGAIALAVLVMPGVSRAVELRAQTLKAWNEYIQSATARNDQRMHADTSFLAGDGIPGQVPKLRRGEIIVGPVGPHTPLKVPFGLIHDWMGAAFIPNVTLEQVLVTIGDYDHYKDIYRPNVVESKSIDMTPSTDRFSMLLMNKSVIRKTALDTSYRSVKVRLDDRRYCSTIQTTRVQEIANYGTESQQMLPEGEGSGLIWRLFSISRLEERDGGVYVELEVIALSRDIPGGLRWFVDPIVRRVSRSALTTSLEQTERAVLSNSVVARNAKRIDVSEVTPGRSFR